MFETSLEERSHEPRRRPRELQAASITGSGHRYRAAPVSATSKNEILQVLFWLQAEGFGDQAGVTLLERFLGVDVHIDVQHLDRLIEEGYVERVGDHYTLTEAGTRKGGIEFAASFEDLTKPVYGECGRSLWCKDPCNEARLMGLAPGACHAGLHGDEGPAFSPVTSLPDT
ncbi:MAG: hypothetical protein M3450_01570 [Actinomycetota bacterium]|nr:hypothetical protein [Actinomycetota bacterium]